MAMPRTRRRSRDWPRAPRRQAAADTYRHRDGDESKSSPDTCGVCSSRHRRLRIRCRAFGEFGSPSINAADSQPVGKVRGSSPARGRAARLTHPSTQKTVLGQFIAQPGGKRPFQRGDAETRRRTWEALRRWYVGDLVRADGPFLWE